MKLGVFSVLLVVALCVAGSRGQDDDNEEDIVIEDAPASPEEEKLNKKPIYSKPSVTGNAYLAEPFDSAASFNKRWIKSEAQKEDTDQNIAKYDGEWSLEEPEGNPIEGDLTLMLKSRAKHHAISTRLDKVYEFNGKPFVMQYEVKFMNSQECGGAYVKLLTEDKKLNLKKLTDKMGYTIMFGPDKCGNDHKLHFIFRHKNPVTGKFEEKHAKKPTSSFDKYFTDKMTHLYTLVVKPDNSFEIYVDQELINSGNLLEDMSPPINPPKEIVDPEDKKPEDWDEREKIPDAEATKPDDWDEDEPEMLVDPSASKPDGWLDDEMELVPDPDALMPQDWDEDMDGEWEPPMIQNPVCESAPGCGDWEAPMVKNSAYKGKWKAPMIDNLSYKGKWKPKKIANPSYFEDEEPYKMSPIGAIGLELWSMSNDIVFDNFMITDDKATADDFAAETWEIKMKQEKTGGSSGRSVVDAVMDATNERPWLWAVFIVVIVLPIVLLIAYCCMPSKPDDARLHPKKTDKPTPDDKASESEDNEKNDEVVADEKSSAGDEGAGNEEAADEEAADEGAGDEGAGDEATPTKVTRASAKATKAKKSDLEAEEQDENEADNEEDENNKPTTKSSPRKRKTKARKD